MSDERLIVTGLGRCGTSMVMQMLAAGGVPVTGIYPAFEDPRFSPLVPLIDAPRGVACKVLDAQRSEFVPGHYRRIALTRNTSEQARSQIKFLRAMGFPAERRAKATIAKSLRRDLPRLLNKVASIGGPMLLLNFEGVLSDPEAAAKRIAEFLGRPMDTDPMAAQVRKRSPRCLPGMLELELMEGR